jgi:hypothetical protein
MRGGGFPAHKKVTGIALKVAANSRPHSTQIKRRIPMRRTVITAALLAAFAIPAFADDATTNKDQTPEMAKASVAGAVSKQDDAAQTVISMTGPTACIAVAVL